MGQDERLSLGIVDSTVVVLWLLQSHLSSYLLRDNTQHRGGGSRGRARHRETGEKGVENRRGAKGAHTNH